MFGHFYNSSLRRYIVLMGDLFSHIQVARNREDGVEYIKVPISYSSKEKFMMVLDKLTNIQSKENVAKVETILPRINLRLVDMMYNATFKTNLLNRSKTTRNPLGTNVDQYSPVPYKMMFELGIYTRYQDDMLQIVEQIVPYFQPHFVVNTKELYDNDVVIDRDIKIVLQSIAIDEQIDGDNITRRRLEWTIMFELNGWLYPPIKDTHGEIRTIYLDFFANEREINPEGQFESVDTEVLPHGVDEQDWSGDLRQTYTVNTPIPTAPTPPGVREEP